MDAKVIELVKKYPNDSELGEAIRKMYYTQPIVGDIIYESPDGGRTIYSHRYGEVQRTLVTQNETV
jgi:hypothetical protein|tara:strand:+ start:180 stop:377 length:198 start_codon:yes stop_codon:yes gene_type:complete